MKWTYSIQSKLTAAAILFLLCLVVLFSNYNDRVHTSKVKGLISTLYQDRIIAEVYIYKITGNLYRIKEGLNFGNEGQDLQNNHTSTLLSEINSTINAYEKTKLTEMEALKFSQFKKLMQNYSVNVKDDHQNTIIKTDLALDLLDDLSDIQLMESLSIVEDAEKTYKLSKFSSEFAFALVIIILLVLQALVFSSKTLHISNKEINANLN